jgi:hypothetical protein
MRYLTHDWKGFFINDIIKEFEFKSYLELGVSIQGESWKRINCLNKIGVDSDRKVSQIFPEVINTTTDFFFQNTSSKFDLIYIDACHEKHQVYRDFQNSFEHLNENGIIIFHDINPILLEHIPSMGNIFELWIDIRNYYKVYSFTGPNQDTVGIFFKQENPNFISFVPKSYSFDYFSENRSRYIQNEKYDDLIKKK